MSTGPRTSTASEVSHPGLSTSIQLRKRTFGNRSLWGSPVADNARRLTILWLGIPHVSTEQINRSGAEERRHRQLLHGTLGGYLIARIPPC